MKPQFNLYYIFLEDKLKNPMREERVREIRRILEEFFRSVRRLTNGQNRLEEKN